MDKVSELPWWLVMVLVTGVILVNVFGYLAHRGSLVSDWYEGAV